VAHEARGQFRDGAWLVELAPLAEPRLVGQAVASIFGVREGAGASLEAALCEALRARELLLVLDNCEHVVGACAALAVALLHACAGVRVLATSREALGVEGEARWEVPSLALPEVASEQRVELLAECESVKLFVERAGSVKQEFALTQRNASPIARLCRQLDGIPLALELAAARVRVLSVEQILERLEDRFRLLTGGDRTALPHHQTLRAAIDWSYDLLSEAERALLRRLSIFAGGWELEAAEDVASCGLRVTTPDVLDMLARLVDKSLVAVEERGERARYRMLETMRVYARERLREAGEEEQALAAHRNWYVSLAERAEGELQGPSEGVWLAQLDAEHDNLRAVLRRSERDGDDGAALRVCAALARFWMSRGHVGEVRRGLQAALARARGEAASIRAKALFRAGGLASYECDFDVAKAAYEESLVLYRAVGDKPGLSKVLYELGLMLLRLGDFEGAAAASEESLRLAEELGDRRRAAWAWSTLGCALTHRGEIDRAVQHLEESLAIFREQGCGRDVAITLLNLSDIAHYQGNLDRAEACAQESFEIARQDGHVLLLAGARALLGNTAVDRGEHARARSLYGEALAVFREQNHRIKIAFTLEGLTCLAIARGDHERALRLMGASSQIREVTSSARAPFEAGRLKHRLDPARQALSPEAAERALAEGRGMTLDQAVEYALESMSSWERHK
jgi:predicted ATPase